MCVYRQIGICFSNCGLASCFSIPQMGDAFKETIRFCVIKIAMRLWEEMALRLHIGEKIGDAFMKKFYVAFIKRVRCVYRKGIRMQLASPGNSPWVRELFRLGLDIMEPFSCSYSFWLAKEKLVVVPLFDRVLKDWFLILVFACKSWRLLYFRVWDVCLVLSWVCFMGCLWWGPESDCLVGLWFCHPTS